MRRGLCCFQGHPFSNLMLASDLKSKYMFCVLTPSCLLDRRQESPRVGRFQQQQRAVAAERKPPLRVAPDVRCRHARACPPVT